MGKWTEQGFVANTEAYYKQALQTLFVEAFGDDFVLDDTTPQGILITRIAELLYNTDMDGIQAFSLLNINTASGVFLDLIGGMRGIQRNMGSPQTLTVQLTCNPNYFTPFSVPQGQTFTLANSDEIFVAVAGKSITSATSTIQLEYTHTGNSSASLGEKLQTTGLSQITDIEIVAMADGSGTETDLDYRTRLRNTYPVANQTIEYIENLIRELPYVKTTGNNYNDTAETVDTLPPYTTEWMAVPKPNTDMNVFKDKIATIIVNNKMPSAPTAGNTTVDVVDLFGKPKTVKFTIPNAIDLQINVQVATPESTGVLDLGGIPNIVAAIAKYVNSLDIGDDVSYSRIMAPLTADSGFDVVKLQIRKLPVAPDWDSNSEYNSGDIVRYNGVFYIANKDTNGQPGVSTDWDVYNANWIDNQNFTIGAREYASISENDIMVGV